MFKEEETGALFSAPIPGGSLTTNPDEPKPWETPPQYTTVEDFVDDLFIYMTSEDNRDGVLNSIRKGVPLEDITQVILFQAFSSGKITPDLQLLSVEPVLYMLIWLAEWAGIPDPVLYPEDDMIDNDDEVISRLEEEAMKGVTTEQLTVPTGISKNLLDKLKEGGTKQ